MAHYEDTCPNCGGSLDKNGSCPYCGAEDFSKKLKVTTRNNEIIRLRNAINKEQKQIDKITAQNSPKGCLKIGMGLLIIAFLIVLGMLFVCRNGQGIEYDIIAFVILAPIVYAISKFCDSSGNDDAQKEIKQHQREITRLTEEIEEIENGTD